MEENSSSKESSGVDNLSTKSLDSNRDCYIAHPNRHLGHFNRDSQVYAYSHHIWLGTIRYEKELEIAYDSAPHRNFSWTNVKVPNFQNQYGQESDVVGMKRSSSCQSPRFQGFHADNYGNSESGIVDLNISTIQRGDLSRKLLFKKMLTPSDVGKLNRVVIPKTNAITYFPVISRMMEEDAKVGVLPDVQVDFFDRAMRCWKFRYCYWKSS